MVRENEVTDARAAHRRRLAAARRPSISNDSESVALREHRLAHRWNINHEELSEKRPIPAPVPWNNQMPLCMGEGEEERRRHADKLIADCERLQADHDARVERWRKTGW